MSSYLNRLSQSYPNIRISVDEIMATIFEEFHIPVFLPIIHESNTGLGTGGDVKWISFHVCQEFSYFDDQIEEKVLIKQACQSEMEAIQENMETQTQRPADDADLQFYQLTRLGSIQAAPNMRFRHKSVSRADLLDTTNIDDKKGGQFRGRRMDKNASNGNSNRLMIFEQSQWKQSRCTYA